jgi:drug/metabolite transporter (DMT)-like permease
VATAVVSTMPMSTATIPPHCSLVGLSLSTAQANAIAYKHGPASLVTPLAGAYPVVTIAFAWAVLKERPTRLQWGGIVAVLIGMVLTTAVATA